MDLAARVLFACHEDAAEDVRYINIFGPGLSDERLPPMVFLTPTLEGSTAVDDGDEFHIDDAAWLEQALDAQNPRNNCWRRLFREVKKYAQADFLQCEIGTPNDDCVFVTLHSRPGPCVHSV